MTPFGPRNSQDQELLQENIKTCVHRNHTSLNFEKKPLQSEINSVIIIQNVTFEMDDLKTR